MSVLTSQPATGTYTFAPSAGDLVLYAFSLCNIRRTELTQAHLWDAAMASNLAMVNLANHLPMRFALELQSLTLVQGTAVYTLANRTICAPIVTIATGTAPNITERTLGPISAYEYQAQPTKLTQGPPASYFFSLLTVPTLTFWPVPDGNGPYTANVQVFRQLQDVDLTNAQGVDSPYRFLDALVTDIAARLAESYAPAKVDRLAMNAEKRLAQAIGRDQESTNITITPALSSYYRTN